MKHNNHLYLYLSLLWFVSGCEIPQEQPLGSQFDEMATLKITDLEDPSQGDSHSELLMEFRVLTYTLSHDKISDLIPLYEKLSKKDVRCINRTTFVENGFSVGVGTLSDGSNVARYLSKIGAVRTGQSQLTLPAEKTDVFSSAWINASEILHVSDSSGSDTVISRGPGLIGWTLAAKPDPRLRGMAQVKVSAAFWQKGFEDIRILMGKEPLQFEVFGAGQFLARIAEGGFILLGPGRNVPELNTLDKKLFYLSGKRPKIQLFVIICDSSGL